MGIRPFMGPYKGGEEGGLGFVYMVMCHLMNQGDQESIPVQGTVY